MTHNLGFIFFTLSNPTLSFTWILGKAGNYPNDNWPRDGVHAGQFRDLCADSIYWKKAKTLQHFIQIGKKVCFKINVTFTTVANCQLYVEFTLLDGQIRGMYYLVI